MSTVLDKFLMYVGVNTRSVNFKEGEEVTHPSSKGQTKLGGMLKEELRVINPEIKIDERPDGSFLVYLPATEGLENAPKVVFAAHMDTYYGVSGEVKPQVHEYSGGDLAIGNGVMITAETLKGLEGKRIATSDGTSLLGADDKAGLAIMMDVVERIHDENLPHGPLVFWVCVDEETGGLDVTALPEGEVETWDVLITVDGERIGPIDVGDFVCRKMTVVFTGQDAHPGVGGKDLKPALYAAIAFANEVTELPSPMETSGMESFFYITEIKGTPSEATVICMPRTFSLEESDSMAERVREFAQEAAGMYGVTVKINDAVITHNTRPAIEAKMHLVAPIVTAFKEHGLAGNLADVRGGTDGGMLVMTYPDLPAPNIGTGGFNIHTVREGLAVEELELMPDVTLAIIANFSQMTK